MRYPPAQRGEIADRLHGVRVPDPYRWLEDPAAPQTRDWLAAQDELWRGHAAGLAGRDRLRSRVLALAATGMVTAPVWRGDRRFFVRQAAGQEHPVLCTAAGDGPVRVLLDPMALDPTGRTTLDAWQASLDGALVAYQVSRDGTEHADLFVMDGRTGEVVEGPVGRCRYSPVGWLADGSGFYYVRTADGRQQVRLHLIGGTDTPVLGGEEGITYGLGVSHDGRWLTISAAPGTAPRNDLWLADLAGSPARTPELRAVRHGTAGRSVLFAGPDGRMYVITDLDAPKVRLCAADPDDPAQWRDLVPEDPEAVLTDVVVLDGILLVGRLRRSVAEITVHDAATGEPLGEVPLPGHGTVGRLTARPSGGHEAWFTYTDRVTPPAVWRYDARTGETTPWEAAPGTVTVPDVVTTELTCTSTDGRTVPVTVIGRAAAAGPRPVILYGYGGFGVPLTPSYAADALAWVEAGGALAIANLRGGGEDGELSHRAGMLEHKVRVFDDFIAAAELLVRDGWTTPGQLGIWGESNGGLLVGAALTRRPDLFAAAVCVAPLLDMVRYEKSGLGAAWRGEYGTVDIPEQFHWLLGYSPYHHVDKGTGYPATLFAVFGGDSRVDPLHARKMCAALQWATAGPGPILLRHEDHVGHAQRSTARAADLAADMLSFMAEHLSLDTDSARDSKSLQSLGSE